MGYPDAKRATLLVAGDGSLWHDTVAMGANSRDGHLGPPSLCSAAFRRKAAGGDDAKREMPSRGSAVPGIGDGLFVACP